MLIKPKSPLVDGIIYWIILALGIVLFSAIFIGIMECLVMLVGFIVDLIIATVNGAKSLWSLTSTTLS